MRYVDLWLITKMLFTLVLIGVCIAIFFSIVHQLACMFRNWLKRRNHTIDHYQGLYDSLIRHLEGSEKR